MKKFFLIISLLMMMPLAAMSCFDIGYDDRYWNFFTMREFREDFEPDFSKFWQEYVGRSLSDDDIRALSSGIAIDANTTNNPIYVAARKKNDKEMLDYLNLLNYYRKQRNVDFDFCSDLYRDKYKDQGYSDEEINDWYSWYYPTKDDLAAEKSKLASVVSKAKAYNGTKYADRYILLAMRAMFQSGQFDELCSYYQQIISKIPPKSDCLYSIDDLYAGALLRTGHKDEAIEIYAKIGDNVSLTWCLVGQFDYNNLMKTYEKNHNSRAIPWMIVQYINRIEFYLRRDYFYDEADSLQTLAFRNDARKFVERASKIADSKATDSPALWKSAAAYVSYNLGNYSDAKKMIDAAITMQGNASVKENARVCRLLIYASDSNYTPQIADFWLKELKWLKFKLKSDISSYIQNLEIITANLKDKYLNVAVSGMYSTICKDDTTGYSVDNGLDYFISFDMPGSQDYTSMYYSALASLTADETEYFYNNFANRDELSKWLWSQIPHDANYFNDLIGTKYLAEGKFDKAAAYLSKVSTKFLDSQTIAKYMYYRDFRKECWIEHQDLGNNINTWFTDEAEVPALKNNPKLDFCNEMITLATKKIKKSEQPQVDYDMAVRYYQASQYGDCWYLARYYRSSSEYNEKVTPNAVDFVDKAAFYLNRAASSSSDPLLKEKALYALVGVYSFDNLKKWNYTEYEVDKSSRQYNAIVELAKFETNRKPSEYVYSCDVYQGFVKNN